MIIDPTKFKLDMKDAYEKLPLEKREQAEAFLANKFSNKLKENIKKEMKGNPNEWWCSYHFGWGMAVRNALRENGFGEKFFGLENIDDYYVEIVERAAHADRQIQEEETQDREGETA